jgi:transcriptional regulator with XRE-family HTH domain
MPGGEQSSKVTLFMTIMKKFDEPGQAILRRIAAALDVPLEQFLTNQPPAAAKADAEECLRLWFKITTEQGQWQALEALRIIAQQEQP